MRVPVVLLACVSCVVTVHAFYVPFTRNREMSWIRRVLDCPYLLYGSYDAYSKCRLGRRHAAHRLPEMTVLEIVEEEPGHVTVIEDEHAGTFAIKVPHKYNLDKPRCKPNEIYVSEVDLCVEAAGHLVKSKVTDNKREQAKQKEDKKEPVTVLQVGEYEKEKCAPGEIWVPEVATCLDRNPPPPLEPEEWPAKPQRRKRPGH